MSRRTAEEARRIRLLKICEENNAKSPEILATIVKAQTRLEAYEMLAIYLDISNVEVPFEDWGLDAESWQRSLQPPVDLYFLFKRKKDQGRFVRKLSREIPNAEVVI